MVLRSWVSMDTSSFTVWSPLSADLLPTPAPILPQPLPPGERGRMPYNREMPLYRGWAVVIACGIIASFSWGLGLYGLGVYLHALNRLHGWAPGLVSGARGSPRVGGRPGGPPRPRRRAPLRCGDHGRRCRAARHDHGSLQLFAV